MLSSLLSSVSFPGASVTAISFVGMDVPHYVYQQYCWKHPLPTEHLLLTVFSLCSLFALLAPVSAEYIKQLLICRGIYDLWSPFLPSFLPHEEFSTAVGQPSLPPSLEHLPPLSVNLHRLFLAVLPACQAKEILYHPVFLFLKLLLSAMPIENLMNSWGLS